MLRTRLNMPLEKFLSALFFLLINMTAFAADQTEYITAKVISITDGDTFRILSNNRRIYVKLVGIDAPYKDQDFGMQAKQALGNLVFNKEVRIQVVSWTGISHLRANVYLDNMDISAEMVRRGFAWVVRDNEHVNTELMKLETEARNFRRGLWGGSHPVPPWLWRKQ